MTWVAIYETYLKSFCNSFQKYRQEGEKEKERLLQSFLLYTQTELTFQLK